DPTTSVMRAPCRGRVVQVHRAKHALTMRTDGGVSILLHIGLDTVKLEGKGFKALVKDGDRVEPNQALIEFDLDAIAQRAPKALVQSGLGEDLSKSPAAVEAQQFVSSDPNVVGGVPAAPGLAVGIVKVKTLEVPAFETKSNRPSEEQQRLHRAIAAAQAELTA